MMPVIRKIHLYAGLALSGLLLVIALSGSALVWKEAWWRTVYEDASVPSPVLTAEGKAAALATILARHGRELRTVKFPSEELPAWLLYLEDGQAMLSPTGLVPIDRWTTRDRVMPFLFDLHAHLLTGEAGARIAGFAALAGIVMVFTGLVLWWPARRKFRLAHFWPQGTARRKMIRWHRDQGVMFTPLLLVLLLTGSGMIFHQTSTVILNGLFGAPRSEPTTLARAPLEDWRPLSDGDLVAAQAAFPEARMVFYSPPREDRPVHGFRLKRPCEIHPNGRTTVEIAPEGGEITGMSDACAASGGQQAQNLLYPLHAGKLDSLLYKWLVFTGGLVLAALAVSGVWAYARSILKNDRRARNAARAAEG